MAQDMLGSYNRDSYKIGTIEDVWYCSGVTVKKYEFAEEAVCLELLEALIWAMESTYGLDCIKTYVSLLGSANEYNESHEPVNSVDIARDDFHRSVTYMEIH